ncbi:MAG: acetyl-CoA carboxylase, carboxyltransferase subunit beta [Chloroflexota bacterium]|nr:MAG: acetyl-CoA carboxylase, carboxyltransferase subunit beta [Chloroflexota bacterium]
MKNLSELLTSFRTPHKYELVAGAHGLQVACPECGKSLTDSQSYQSYGLCDNCRHHLPVPARRRIEMVVDPKSFREVNNSLVSVDPLSFSDRMSYRQRLKEAQRKTGLTDAVVTGLCKIGGNPAVILALDFDFLGGSMGSVVGEKVALAFELAAKKKMPAIALATSGGARMQEGMLSLVQMAKTAAAAQRLHAAGLPFISVLSSPTMGGVYASFASLADIIIAEPRAVIGFNGPRVIEQTTGEKLPEGSHTAEFLLTHGMIDRIVDRAKLRDTLLVLLDLLSQRYRLTAKRKDAVDDSIARSERTPWSTVQLARHHERPTSLDYIGRMMPTFVELHGDRLFGDDPAVVGGLADLGGETVMVVAQERGRGEEGQKARHFGRAMPEGYRKSLRLMQLAAKFRLPVVTLVDTPGANGGFEAETRGIASTLSRCMAEMSVLPTQTIAAVIGEGGSGGALALAVADRVLMLENAIYSVIAPEGAGAILYRDAGKAQDLAASLRLTAPDCKLLGVIDAVIPEPEGGAHLDHDQAAWHLKTALLRNLVELQALSTNKLLRNRYAKFRRMGEIGSYYREAVMRELSQLQEYLTHRLDDIRDHLPRRTDGGAEPSERGPAVGES